MGKIIIPIISVENTCAFFIIQSSPLLSLVIISQYVDSPNRRYIFKFSAVPHTSCKWTTTSSLIGSSLIS